MKTTLHRQEFLDALTAISSLTGSRTTKPILACVKLTAQDDHLELCATDGEAALRLGLAALTVEQAGETVVTADRLLGIVRELPDVEITLATDERQCTIRGATSEFKIYVQNVADFPPVPELVDEPDLVVDGRVLRRMIDLTLYAAAREMSRFAINGVLWDKQGKRLFLVATDGRRLARAGGPIVKAQAADFDVIVPAKALTVLERVFNPPKDGADWHIDVKVTPNQALLRAGTRMLATTLVEGHFPRYQEVIPTENDKLATIERNELYGAVRRAALLTTEDSRAVRLAFEANRLVVTSQSPEQGEARIDVPIEYQGEPLTIGFNPAFLSDALKVVPFERVQIEMRESFRPGVLSGGDKNEFLYVVMPVSLAP